MKTGFMTHGITALLVLALLGAGCGKSSNPCMVDETLCNGVCVDTSTDRNNCGGCGVACENGQYCLNGNCETCVNECTEGEKRCVTGVNNQYQICGDPDNDTCKEWGPPQNCGAGEICFEGECMTGCEDECSRIGAQACDKEGANGYRVCDDWDEDECLEWGPLNSCGVGYTCVEGDCELACEDECDTEDATRCAPPPQNGIESCEDHDSDGCLEWGGLIPCEGGTTCDPENVECSADCTDECSPGERICEGAGYRTCGQHDADVCLDWSDITNCKSWEVCNPDTGQCETACTDACEQGQRRCGSDTEVELCANHDADPCLEWGVIDTCDSGEICTNGECVEDCKDECEPQGERICQNVGDDPAYRVCGQNDDDSCLEWEDPILCDAGQTCSAGVCSDDCIDECEVGERECFGAGWRECGESGDGDDCRDWLAVNDCEAWEICDTDTATCVTNCSDECNPSLSQQCDDDNSGYMVCGNWNEDPCLEWSTVTECPDGQVCDPFISDCVDDCTDECQNTGDKQCADADTFETCGNWDSDSCLEWGDATDCTAGWVCSNGVCEETCSDECVTDNPPITVCEGTIGWRVCDYLDEDECLDLGDINYCAGNEECVDGDCEVICEDECSPGDRACDGNDVLTCADYDDDPCVEMGVMTSCSGGTVCYKGNCVGDTPPTTVLINEILYDDESYDGEEVYIEIFGQAGQVLDNFSIVSINGSDGLEEARFDLDGFTLPASGHFVVAHPDTTFDPEWYDALDEIADLQNGPDSVIVQWAGQVTVDALGYPGGGSGSIPVVEGDPAPSAGYDNGNEIMYCLSRGANHADTDDNSVDFLKRTMCTPGWEGPGAILWTKMVYGGVSTPALDSNGYIYTVDSWGWPTKIDSNTDEHDVVFNNYLPDGADGLSSIALAWDESTAYVGSTNGLYALDPNDGDVLWGPVWSACEVYSTPLVDPVYDIMNGWVYFGANCPDTDGTAHLVAVDSSGTEQWAFEADAAIISSPVRVLGGSGEDYVVFGEADDGTGSGRVVCVDNGDNGSLVWEYPTGSGCWSSPAVGSDGTTIYIGCDDGMLYAIDGVLGTIKSGFPVEIHDPDTATETLVDGCSPTIAPGADGRDFIFMTSRADTDNAYVYRDDGELAIEKTLGVGNSSITIAADAFWLVHTGDEIQGFNLMGDKEWYAVLADTHYTWITSSPAVAAGGIVYVLEFTGWDAFTGRLLAIQGSADMYTGQGAYPKFRGDWGNTGWGF